MVWVWLICRYSQAPNILVQTCTLMAPMKEVVMEAIGDMSDVEIPIIPNAYLSARDNVVAVKKGSMWGSGICITSSGCMF